MEFCIGQTFEGVYPPEAAVWCNKNNAHIEKLNGVMTIVANPAPPETKTLRTFAKDAIWVATKDLLLPDGSNAWQKFYEFLMDSGLWMGWLQQAYLLEENPFFAEFYPKAVTVFGKELVDSVLKASVVGSKTVAVE